MANSTATIDVYSLLNSMAAQATGRSDLVATDTSTFASVGETILRTGTESALSALSQTLSETIFSIRPYKAKLQSLYMAQKRWGGIVRKVVNLYKGAEASTDHNTTTATPLTDGQSIDMYKINKPEVMQLNFYGTKVLQKSITRFRDQLSVALSNEAEFEAFVNSIMVEFGNEIELLNEAKTRATLVNYIAGISSMGLYEVDLTKEYNDEFGTSYTREELLSTQLESFMKFVAATIKIYSSRLTDMSVNYHASITGYSPIMRHTPKAKQKMIMYEPVFTKAQATVYPTLFNPKYLEIGSYEGVNYWQAQNDPTKIKCTPNILNVSTGASATAEAEVELPFVLGLLYDTDAIGVWPQFDYTSTTPFNSAGGYYNMFVHWRFNSFCDYTENAILFVMGDGADDNA